jgi:streptomycin 6-kinase
LSGLADRLYLIDPRGVSGELAYDVAVIALKGERYAPPTETAAALARNLAVPADRVDAWQRIARAARV